MVFPGVQAKLIKQVTCGYHHTAFLMSDGSLYIYGVVGRQAFITQALDSTAHGESLYSPSRVQYIPPEHKASRPLQISSGSSTLAWVTASGEVIIHTTSGFRPFRVRAFGNHKELQFGKATQVSCGARHIAVVNSFGQLFTWGWNQHGQLGHGNTINELGPRQVIFPDKISESDGTKHTAALSDRGHLYLFGDGSSGQLGQNDLSPRTRPTRCTAGVLSETVSQVVCGETFTAVLTNKGEVVVLGKFEGVHDHEHPDSHSQYTAEESVHASNLRSMQVQIPPNITDYISMKVDVKQLNLLQESRIFLSGSTTTTLLHMVLGKLDNWGMVLLQNNLTVLRTCLRLLLLLFFKQFCASYVNGSRFIKEGGSKLKILNLMESNALKLQDSFLNITDSSGKYLSVNGWSHYL
eukprot:CAMPEP_0171517768 /NCGR_PEP_ID=MMETSP0959-20130129/4883_1 /TAXON_ID=87120 /ORGANISM="Aurantiochytrium limacinum, Strain ATCCMYA-1381" /LENGTH=407 /DNA_ID=CAMNT_0012056841 /DNA_START=25 /DNA_END=1250 /DNA_ORIENTATION=-